MPSLKIPLTPDEVQASKILRDAVYNTGVSHAKIARTVNRSNATISQIINGHRRVPLDLVEPISSLLNVSPNVISPVYKTKTESQASASTNGSIQTDHVKVAVAIPTL